MITFFSHRKLNWGYDFWLSVCSSAIAIQVAVFCFNCIPAQPLDGGRVFGAFLNWKKFNQKDSFYISAIVGWVSCVLCYVMQCYVILFYVISSYVTFLYVMFCNFLIIILYYIMLCNIMLCYVKL